MRIYVPKPKYKPIPKPIHTHSISKSPNLKLTETKCVEPVFVIQQFYVDKDKTRDNEIKFCLQQNCSNPLISKIYLLNERLYNKIELGVKDDSKIVQVDINKRLRYSDVFNFVNENRLKGFIIFCNSDIMFDTTLENLFYSDMSKTKTFLALTRYEFINKTSSFQENCDNSRLLSDGHDSQDSWIFHSNFNVPDVEQNTFTFNFGLPGCDNHIMFLFVSLGYKVYNVPQLIRTYHYHTSNVRHYDESKRIRGGYSFLQAWQ